MAFTFTKCVTKEGIEFPGLYEIQPKVFGDARGYFFESYSKKDFFEAGLDMEFVQDNQSYSTQGVLRGLHFQTNHPQGKLVRAMSGKVYDVAVDLRNDSPTFGKYYAVLLDSEKQNQFYIPKGFAHGFYVISETAVFAYKCTDFYDPTGDGGIMWDSADIDWTSVAPEIKPLLSEKDTKHPRFDKNTKYFTIEGKFIGGNNA